MIKRPVAHDLAMFVSLGILIIYLPFSIINKDIIKYSYFVIFMFCISSFILYYYLKKTKHINHNDSSHIENLNCKLMDQIAIKESEISYLHEVSKMILTTFDLKDIVECTYSILTKVTGCEWYHICFTDSKTGNFICNYEYGDKKSIKVMVPLEVDIMSSSEIDKMQDDERSISFISNALGDIIKIPLNVSDSFIGVIYIGSSKSGIFSGVNLEFLKILANFAAISVKNSDMFSNIYEQKMEIEALYEEAAAGNDELNSYIAELDNTKIQIDQKNNELTNLLDSLNIGYLQTVMCLANSIEAKDSYTRGHCQRVMEISCEIGRAMGLTEQEIDELRYAAILHDIGKIGVPASILNKESKLTDEEFNEIKKHPAIAYNILKDVEFLKNGLSGILQHHERYDGKGYPNGLSGNEIDIYARIMCVADAFDAMTSDRPYRKAMKTEDALKELKKYRGIQFDPQVVNLFLIMNDIDIEEYPIN